MARKLYQIEWNGIDLLKIAEDKRTLSSNGLPNGFFYEKFYSALKEKAFDVDDTWRKSKLNNSIWLEKIISDIVLKENISPNELNILSVGAGLGIVELPLIQKGYDITLHEVQSNSLDFALTHITKMQLTPKKIIGSVPNLPVNQKYRIIYLGTVEYAVADKVEYQVFLNSLANLLLPGGYLISYDPYPYLGSQTFRNKVGNILRFFKLLKSRKTYSVYWGVLRTLNEKIFCWKKAGFKIRKYGFIDSTFRNLFFESDVLPMSETKIQKLLTESNTIGYLIAQKHP